MLILVMRPLDFSLCNNTDSVQYIFAKPAIKKTRTGIRRKDTKYECTTHRHTHTHRFLTVEAARSRGG